MAQSNIEKLLFGTLNLIGNVFWLAGFAYMFAPKQVGPYIPPALSDIISQYPQSPLILIVLGMLLAAIPSLYKLLDKFDKPVPTSQQAAEKQRIDKLLKTDPVALKAHWTPVNEGGHYGRSARLVSTNNQRINTKITKSTIFATLSTIVFTAGFIGFVFYGPMTIEEGGTPWYVIPLLLLVIAIAVYFLVKLSTPMVFDKSNGWFWRGYGLGEDINKIRQHRNSLQLHEIYALQVMSEKVRIKKSSYISHELNLVLKDGSRRNILDHSDKPTLLSDAQLLADFLNVDIWLKDD